MGNSDHSESRGPGREIISLDGPAPVWQAFMRDYTKSMPVARFQPPEGLVRTRIDAWTGGRPGSFTRQTTTALFIKGTQPGIKKAVDPPGLMYVRSCGGWRIDLTKAEPERAWRDDVLGWMARARSGAGRFGRYRTATAYLPGRGSWGGSMVGSCAPSALPGRSERQRQRQRERQRERPVEGLHATAVAWPDTRAESAGDRASPASADRWHIGGSARHPAARGGAVSADGAAGRGALEEAAVARAALVLAVLDDDLATREDDVAAARTSRPS